MDKEIKIIITDTAKSQIQLIKENDFTLVDQEFRLTIGGKECDGFTYQMGFDSVKPQDLEFQIGSAKIIMDEFTHHYCQEGIIDFFIDPDQNVDGFIFENQNQDKYYKKFFEDESMAPGHLDK